MKYLNIMAIVLLFAACSQQNSNPELLDVIYLDLKAELAIADTALSAEEKNLLSLLKEKNMAVPQTGQIKFANKKIVDSEAKINALKQQKLFFEIKMETRLKHDQIKYQESLRPGGKPWPDTEEAALYNSVVKFQRDKIAWDRNKGLKKLVPRGTKK